MTTFREAIAAKACLKCGEVRPITEFNADNSKPGKRKTKCKRCTQAETRAWRAKNKDRVDAYQKAYYRENAGQYAIHNRNARFRRFGLTQETYDALLARQGGGCAICGVLEGQMTIDHDHACCPDKYPARTCGQCTRGILCHACNMGIGKFGDDPQRLLAAYNYLSPPVDRLQRQQEGTT